MYFQCSKDPACAIVLYFGTLSIISSSIYACATVVFRVDEVDEIDVHIDMYLPNLNTYAYMYPHIKITHLVYYYNILQHYESKDFSKTSQYIVCMHHHHQIFVCYMPCAAIPSDHRPLAPAPLPPRPPDLRPPAPLAQASTRAATSPATRAA